VGSFTLFIVAKIPDPSSNYGLIGKQNNEFYVQVFSNTLRVAIGTGNAVDYNFSDTAYRLLTIEYDGSLSGNTNRVQVWNGETKLTSSANSGTIPATVGTTSGITLLDFYGGGVVPLVGDEVEICLYTTKLSQKLKEWEWDRLINTYGLPT
jgi:hypothetical protein